MNFRTLITQVMQRVRRRPRTSAAIGIALVLGSPSVVGQFTLGFPVLEQMTVLQESQLARVGFGEFLFEQILWQPAGFLLAIGGLVALILASPGLGWKRRLKFPFIGALILYLFHAFQVATKFENHFSHDRGPYSTELYSDFERILLEIGTRFFEVFGQQALPFAIWALLCAPIILKSLRRSPPAREENVSD